MATTRPSLSPPRSLVEMYSTPLDEMAISPALGYDQVGWCDIKESTKLVILTRTLKKRIGKKVTTTKEEIGRYDRVYESTAGHGGTIFWKNSAGYLRFGAAGPAT